MNIEGFIIKEYVAGWSVDSPYQGVDKDGNPKTQYKQTYHTNLRQCLDKVRDVMAKDCESLAELLYLLKAAEDTDLNVLRANGLLVSPKVIKAEETIP